PFWLGGPCDNGQIGVRAVEQLAEPVEDDTPLESWDRDAWFRESAFEAEVKIRDDEGPLLAKEEREVPRRFDASRDLDAVHYPTKAAARDKDSPVLDRSVRQPYSSPGRGCS